MLSDRLQLIADMTPECKVMADIGTDHGYLPIALVKAGKVSKAYAMDVNEGPLEKANKNIQEAKANQAVATILSNGLEHLPSDVATVVIAGMGGMLISKILESEQGRLEQVKDLIVSPHLDEGALRKKVHELGWQIVEEVMVADKGKFYTVIHCQKGEETYSRLGYTYGQLLMTNKDPVWQAYLKNKLDKLNGIKLGLKHKSTDQTLVRLKEIDSEIDEIKAVLKDES